MPTDPSPLSSEPRPENALLPLEGSQSQPIAHALFHERQLFSRQPAQQTLGFDSGDRPRILDQKRARLEERPGHRNFEPRAAQRLRVGDDRDEGTVCVSERCVQDQRGPNLGG